MGILSVGFQGTLQWVQHHGYSLIFVLMLIEGPVVTAAAAFAAALHYLNIWIIFLLSILGNLIPDGIYYAIGYWGRHRLVDHYGHYIGITKERLELTERLIHDHAGKALVTIKMVPFLATPGLIVAGISKMDVKRYAWWCTIITIPSTLFYLILGYYFGAAYGTIDHYLHIGGYFIVAAFAIIVVIGYFQRSFFEKMLAKM
jgi:membrane protein DedA with SNARE-associated domain